ncbi:hypothetical protein [Streptomyces chartreusis]|nr:hypothetical protein [Streptomyces chartreusis]
MSAEEDAAKAAAEAAARAEQQRLQAMAELQRHGQAVSGIGAAK